MIDLEVIRRSQLNVKSGNQVFLNLFFCCGTEIRFFLRSLGHFCEKLVSSDEFFRVFFLVEKGGSHNEPVGKEQKGLLGYGEIMGKASVSI